MTLCSDCATAYTKWFVVTSGKVKKHRQTHKGTKAERRAIQESCSLDTSSVAAILFRKTITEKVMVWGCVLDPSLHHKHGKVLATSVLDCPEACVYV